jgi:hypothetical protein
MFREGAGLEALMPQYAYSLNGENWKGAFPTREQALGTAFQRCDGVSDPPGSVFVGEIPTTEAFADHLGHALIIELRRRARTRGADNAIEYLRDVTTAEIKQLDEAIEAALMSWLQANHLLPDSAKIRSISEHPVPLPHRAFAAP